MDCERKKIEILLRMNMKKRVITKEIGISERTMYNYINSGLFLNIDKSHLLYNKKDKLMKSKEKSIIKKMEEV